MSRVTLVTGGARSGKSTYGEKLIANRAKAIAYIATAIPFDGEMKSRIAKHREQRPSNWTTLECWKTIHEIIPEIFEDHQGVILDCLTIMVTNFMLETSHINWERPHPDDIFELQQSILAYVEQIMLTFKQTAIEVVIITNELGMGIVPENPLARAFRDIAGRVNQLVAEHADEVVLVVCGQSLKIK